MQMQSLARAGTIDHSSFDLDGHGQAAVSHLTDKISTVRLLAMLDRVIADLNCGINFYIHKRRYLRLHLLLNERAPNEMVVAPAFRPLYRTDIDKEHGRQIYLLHRVVDLHWLWRQEHEPKRAVLKKLFGQKLFDVHFSESVFAKKNWRLPALLSALDAPELLQWDLIALRTKKIKSQRKKYLYDVPAQCSKDLKTRASRGLKDRRAASVVRDPATWPEYVKVWQAYNLTCSALNTVQPSLASVLDWYSRMFGELPAGQHDKPANTEGAVLKRLARRLKLANHLWGE